MSALGHKQTCSAQAGMSALHPIATAKADSRKPPCLLYPRKRTCAVQTAMSALGQKRTHAPQQTASLFDHLVGTTLHRLRHGEAERLGGLEVDDHFELAEDLSYRAAYAAFSKPSACIASLTFGRAPTRSA